MARPQQCQLSLRYQCGPLAPHFSNKAQVPSAWKRATSIVKGQPRGLVCQTRLGLYGRMTWVRPLPLVGVVPLAGGAAGFSCELQKCDSLGGCAPFKILGKNARQ